LLRVAAMQTDVGSKPVDTVTGTDTGTSQSSSVKTTVSSRLIFLVGGCILLLFGVSALAIWSQRTNRLEADWLMHTVQVRYQLSRIELLLVETQADVRGYALARDDAFLNPYRDAAATMEPELARLQQLISDNPNQRPRASRLAALAHELSSVNLNLLQAAQNGESARVQALIADARPKQLMNDVRAVLSDMQSEEDRLFQLRSASVAHSQRYAILSLWATGGLGVVLILLVVYFARRDEALLQRAERELATALRSIGDAVIATDTSGSVRFMNPIAERLTGWPEASARGRPVAEVFRVIGEDTRSPIESPVRRVLQDGKSVAPSNHALLVSRDGTERAIADSGAPIMDERGQVQGLVLVFRDVSEARRTEQTLRLRDAELQTIHDYARFPIAHCDPHYRYIFVNRAYAERLGLSPEDCVGQYIWDIAGKRAYESVRPYMDEALAGRTAEFEIEIPYERELGARWMRCIYAPVIAEEGKVSSFVAAVTDITDRKHAEKELQRLLAAVDAEKERLTLVLSSINDEVWFADSQGRFTLANPSALREFGYSDVQGVEVDRLANSVLVLRPDGSVRPSHEAPPLRALAGEVIVGEEEIVRTPRAGELRHREVNAAPVRDHSGQIIGAVAIVRDITQHKRAQAALRDADRRKDEFLATLSHELRNPLAPIRMAAQILALPHVAPQKLQWAQSVIQRQVQHMALLLDDLLDIARITQGKLELKKQTVTLNGVIDAAVEAARPLIDGKNHRLTVILPPAPIDVEADPLRLAQVLSNLLTNAAKYSDPGATIVVRAEARNDALDISVKDQGIGIAPDSLGRVFDMFTQVESSTARSDGLGIGLALVRGLTELHGGTVEAKSDGLGCGSEFVVRLPLTVSNPAASHRTPQQRPVPAPRVGHRVLVADDNRDAADSLAMLLELSGHDVRVAHDGRTALSLAQVFRPDISLLDIGMPDLSGYEVAQALRRETWGAQIRLIALTGWGQEDDRRRAQEAGFDHHLTKPVDPEMLESVLSAAGDC
jgi:PAS domain S-box-containing protein